jgi:hypothetical protein
MASPVDGFHLPCIQHGEQGWGPIAYAPDELVVWQRVCYVLDWKSEMSESNMIKLVAPQAGFRNCINSASHPAPLTSTSHSW